MVNFTENNSLKIVNSFYKKRKNKKWTWLSPDGNTKNEIDYFIVNDLRIVSDIARQDNFEFLYTPHENKISNFKPNKNQKLNIVKQNRALCDSIMEYLVSKG